MKNQLIISCVIVAVIFGAGGFYGGMQYANSQRGAGAARFAAGGAAGFQRTGGQGGNAQFRGGQGGAFAGGGASGEVLSKDDKSLTLKLADGGSKVVYLSASTTVSKMDTGSIDDVAQGSNVMVIGSPNADGSVTASMIQLRPARAMMNGNASTTNN
ncbi:MAG TPA: hypothetical protein VMU11_04570 [Verrucomicrobiae bacterium]|nr:hypothetical protein [Verrucomicrobiae bacterium]